MAWHELIFSRFDSVSAKPREELVAMGTAIVLLSLVISQFLTYHISECQQIKHFLKNKYGNNYGKYVGNTKSTNSHTKTKTKSTYAGVKSHSGYNPLLYHSPTSRTNYYTNPSKSHFGFNGGCSSQPPHPMNAGVKCSSYSGCRANCIPNYQFPNGQTQMRFTCVDGRWQVEGIEVTSVSACEPICSPPCQNSGICVAPNQCNCQENYSGPQCQFENKPCLNHPQIPMNSRRTCNSKKCTVTCMRGHQFPDGSEITTMECKNGIWVPTNERWASLPNCMATCTPPCQNGGNCLSFNVCQCPQDYRGPQCQYTQNACSVKKLPTNGGYNCTGDLDSYSCSINCPDGINFEFPPAPVYRCEFSMGVFLPSPLPKCLYPQNANILREPGSSDTYYQLNRTNLNIANLLGGHGQLPVIYGTQSAYSQHAYTVPDEFINETNIQQGPDGYYSKNEHQLVTVENRLPKPGSCFHWGGTHYKTFDDRVYSFDSKCAHILVRDAVDNTFSIITQNHGDCYREVLNCHTVIRIYFQDKQYFLKLSPEGIPIFGTGKKILPIPGQSPGIRIEMAAHFLIVALDTVGITLRWDGENFLQVEAKENLWNRTEGLCGKIDGDPSNDIMTEDGHIPKNVATLANSWKASSLEDNCDDSPVEEKACKDTDVEGSVGYEAKKFCKKIMANKIFAACQRVVDITSLYDACRSDFCNCKGGDRSQCACETLDVYVRDCSNKGVKGLTAWRDEDTCPMQCTGGKVYKSCGPAKGQPACGAISEVPDENENACEEGCFCPSGTVINEGKCITKDKCPCRLRGKTFPPGYSVPKDCNTCTCIDGQWVCTQVDCGARCSAIGDPHYSTFDGRKYDFMGQCSYYLVKSDNFSIEAENTPCAGSISQAMNFPSSISSGLPSCTKTVTVKMDGHIIKMKQNHDLVVNGQDIPKVPYNVGGIKIRSVSSIFLQAQLPNGIEIWWDGSTRVYVDLPPKFQEKTRGLCGTFNDNQKDDFLTPEDDVEQSVVPFANKWKTSEKCNDVAEVLASHPCDKNIQKKALAEKYCAKIKSDLFKDCHWFVDPDQFYQDCLYDMCSCEFSVSKCLCPIISSYAAECSRKNIKINWRLEVRECGVHCPGGQKYQICGNSCTRTCFDISENPDCKTQCVEGCNCPEGEALDEDGECIPIGRCECTHEGLDFPSGYKEVRPASKGQEICTCTNGHWQCKEATSQDIKLYPGAHELNSRCNASANMEFTTCEQVEPVTCKNMHSPDLYSSSVCHSGCQCKKGYVLDTSSKQCVKPTECPCHHGGKSYKEKSTVQSECNTCLCQNGRWKCTDRQCTAECSAWGDSHYKTFDGKRFDYQGQCDYVLAKASLGSDKFDITIQNVPCGSLGTTCSKSITVRVSSGKDTDTIILAKDKSIPRYKIYKHVTVRTKGTFVIVEAPDLGLNVHWDRGTRVYVKVDPRWKDNTKGLCGNYNDNEADDFQTPSGGLTEVSTNIFGDSWRLQSYCPDALEVTDTCQSRPDRKVWAVKKCGILKSALFAPCHSEVPMEYFLEKCVFDSCACDQGGDCECFCTAVAAYAQECNNRGVPIKWRSQELCPMQCDQRCTEYSPCISTCPEDTCEDLLVNTKITKSCGADTCIEGCAAKPCPPGHIYTNSSLLECIPKNVCKPVCIEINNVTYYEGDLMEEDDCHSCYCSREKKICNGQPCTTTTEYLETTTPQMDQIVSCKSGWTRWINRDRTASIKTKKRNNKKEVEPLPSPIYLNNLEGSSRCNISDMVDIECRTVDTHTPSKETGLDVECSLENGLICQSTIRGKLCPDFEIRVLCQCEEETTPEYMTTPEAACEIGSPSKEHPTNCYKFYECAPGLNGNEYKTLFQSENYVERELWDQLNPPCLKKGGKKCFPLEAEIPRCPPGMKSDSCAIECDRLCIHYSYIVREKGHCKSEQKCEFGCVSAEKKKKCPKGMMWADENTCVSVDTCLCVHNGKPVKPGEVFEEEGCKLCQCIDNAYTCHVRDDCNEEERLLPFGHFKETTEEPEPTMYITSSITPPPQCDEDRLADLLPLLPNAVFTASSTLSKIFAPKNARLDSLPSESSGGSWAPKHSNQDQYLEIDLGKQELVYGITVKGSPLYDEFVTSYKVLYSPNGHQFYYVLNDKNYPKEFRGSIDASTPIRQLLDTPVEAKVIRINPQTWNHGISLRVELIGCPEEMPSTIPPPSTPHITYMPTMKPEYCDDEMGLGDGTMSVQQVTTSSDLSPKHSKEHLKLSDESSWQPLTNSHTEWIMVI
ncbi:hypothetical protein JTB14_017666 [Gonioctena quinquepunctata]|nr:hypothetical protein JTB14_017666 [Gonioctena quinquepunctata]